jgi:hypothetical protein
LTFGIFVQKDKAHGKRPTTPSLRCWPLTSHTVPLGERCDTAADSNTKNNS